MSRLTRIRVTSRKGGRPVANTAKLNSEIPGRRLLTVPYGGSLRSLVNAG